jgi:peptidoglycan/LPS O-acetylase OafA/YrhL
MLLGIGAVIIIQEFLPLKLLAGHYIYSILFGILLFVLSTHPFKLIVNKATVYLGKISFSLYLCHIAVYYWLTQLGINHYLPANPYLNFSLRFFILLCASSFVATFLYLSIEKGGIILGKKIINRHEKITSTNIASTARTW